MKKIFNVTNLAILSILLGFSSCSDDEVELNVLTDAYVIKKMSDDNVAVYAIAYYAYANKNISTASVLTPDEATINLSASESTPYTFMKEPEEADFLTDIPVEDNYLFDVVAKSEETAQSNDYLEFDDLNIPSITDTTYDSESNMLNVTWEAVPKCDGYVVRLFDLDGNIIYTSNAINPETAEYEIYQTSGNWFEQAIEGTSYKLQVQSFAYESDATAGDFAYNLKEISISEKEIVWGE